MPLYIVCKAVSKVPLTVLRNPRNGDQRVACTASPPAPQRVAQGCLRLELVPGPNLSAPHFVLPLMPVAAVLLAVHLAVGGAAVVGVPSWRAWKESA